MHRSSAHGREGGGGRGGILLKISTHLEISPCFQLIHCQAARSRDGRSRERTRAVVVKGHSRIAVRSIEIGYRGYEAEEATGTHKPSAGRTTASWLS